MAIELKIPEAGESITEVTIAEWVKEEGAYADSDETVAVIETDKANVDLVAPKAGRISKILKSAGEAAEVGEVIGYMEAGDAEEAEEKKAEVPKKAEEKKAEEKKAEEKKAEVPKKAEEKREKRAEKKKPAVPKKAEEQFAQESGRAVPSSGNGRIMAAPSVRRAIREGKIDPEAVSGSGPGGRISMQDLVRARAGGGSREIEPVPMTRMRSRIAERLVEAQRTAALLTTFNEIDMTAVMSLRSQYKQSFQEKYGIKLGFMSFFVKAVIEGLKEFPAINAQIQGDRVLYHDYYDIGVAVGGGRGLVVPVIRNAERMSFAEIEEAIADFAQRAKNNRIQLEELQGGTFTISNGGVYGSLMSTPIVNPPQSGILGMHTIQERPVVRDGRIEIGKMMYVALTYDHRIIDGREAVTFLVRVKECLEAPARMLLEI